MKENLRFVSKKYFWLVATYLCLSISSAQEPAYLTLEKLNGDIHVWQIANLGNVEVAPNRIKIKGVEYLMSEINYLQFNVTTSVNNPLIHSGNLLNKNNPIIFKNGVYVIQDHFTSSDTYWLNLKGQIIEVSNQNLNTVEKISGENSNVP